jgi:hypothetical protein
MYKNTPLQHRTRRAEILCAGENFPMISEKYLNILYISPETDLIFRDLFFTLENFLYFG